MISKIRVEARAASMDEARSEIETLMEHAGVAAFLEGIRPSVSKVSDDHFGRALDSDKWAALGLDFEGRIVVSFTPEVVSGGLKQFSYRTVKDDSDQLPPDSLPEDNGRDVTGETFVLVRKNPVTREHVWEGTSTYEDELAREVEGEPVEEMLARLRSVPGTMFNITPLEQTTSDSPSWRIDIHWVDPNRSKLGQFGPAAVYADYHSVGVTLRDAVRDALGQFSAPGFPMGPAVASGRLADASESSVAAH